MRTPTDTMGQHIHLVKFDVLASDGAGNGFNYEDGTFSPEEVIERIRAIRKFNGCVGVDSGDPRAMARSRVRKPSRILSLTRSARRRPCSVGTPTTFSIISVSIEHCEQFSRTITSAHPLINRPVFTPAWLSNRRARSGGIRKPALSLVAQVCRRALMVDQRVGAPTFLHPTKRTVIASFFEVSDFQFAYDGNRPVNPPARDEVGLPFLLKPAEKCPGSGFAPPCPEAIAAADVGTMSVNYRNEPVALRVRDPNTNKQAGGSRRRSFTRLPIKHSACRHAFQLAAKLLSAADV